MGPCIVIVMTPVEDEDPRLILQDGRIVEILDDSGSARNLNLPLVKLPKLGRVIP